MNIEVVSWLDHHSVQGWQIKPEVVDYIATTVGFIVHEDKNYLVLAQSLGNVGDAFADTMHIIKRNITARRTVELD